MTNVTQLRRTQVQDAADVNEERLARFFIKTNGTYQMEPRIRECMTFAEHNVIQDPPFPRLDLISCRNLMIYIEPELQQKILNLFGFASLSPPGAALYFVRILFRDI